MRSMFYIIENTGQAGFSRWQQNKYIIFVSSESLISNTKESKEESELNMLNFL